MTRKEARGPQPLSVALSELIALRGLARVRGDAQLQAIWSEVAGPHIAAQTRVLDIKRGVLEVGVRNAPLMSELASFHKTALLNRLMMEHADLKIRDLKFRLKADARRS